MSPLPDQAAETDTPESTWRWSRFVGIGECMVELAPVEGGTYALGYAGDSFNTAWYLRRLCGPGPEVDYLSAVGDDRVSDAMLRFMEDAGIGTSLVRRAPGKTVGLYVVTLDAGERSFSYWRSASAARDLARDLHGLDAAGPGWLLYLSGITMAILAPPMRDRLLRRLADCRRAGALVVFDPNIRPRLWEDVATMRGTIEAAAGTADLIFPSFDDESTTFGDAMPAATAARYLGLGARLCIVKNAGAAVHVAGEGVAPFDHPVESVADPVDTTAAGDAFNAGVLMGLRSGMVLRDCVALGAAVSRQVINGRGALVPLDRDALGLTG
ncbi:sugar kinase [Rhodobacterales bacterium HKCCSP123]|nr:sugar kinase [Rhodobacterales bacterium HKCCSP123]